jgi:hypothetical protein
LSPAIFFNASSDNYTTVKWEKTQ